MTSIKFRALTHDDHKLFFEALGEYGKDFQNIQQYMAQKSAKGNQKSADLGKSIDHQEKRDQDKKEDDKKREQIRNFYNKLHTKLSQLVCKLDDRVEKVNQELYLLINYGEIWKKLGFKFNNKTKKLLEELVYQGYTILRFKNKNVRLRTPPCKALKKINEIGIDEKVKVVTTRELPKDIIVEFHPATSHDWLRVQSLSQNPRVRARLSIQKRLSNIIGFLESKWNISQDKLNRTIDVWLKVPSNNQQSDESHGQNQLHFNTRPEYNASNNQISPNDSGILSANGKGSAEFRSQNVVNRSNLRLRLKPSSQHELKEVNITRVIPDNHLDLSLNAYVNRINESKSKNFKLTTETFHTEFNNHQNGNIDHVQNEAFQSSRLPISLTTPDSSILFERSCTSDQPSIAQARKHLNFLQSLTGSLEGCENSRTACEDTQDRSLLNSIRSMGQHSHDEHSLNSTNLCHNLSGSSVSNVLVNNNIPALYDEDAALPVSCSQETFNDVQTTISNHGSSDSKSVDFNIPKNVTLGDYFKMAGHQSGIEVVATSRTEKSTTEESIDKGNDQPKCSQNDGNGHQQNGLSNLANPHKIEIQKLAEGWTIQDGSSMTIGELYLAFKCPDKIILEYMFEECNDDARFSGDGETGQNNGMHGKSQSVNNNNILLFKLLTAANISLARIERHKQEQQHKLHEQQSCSKFRRRKGQDKNLTLHDIETTNQRVEEALKQLQPTRLSSYRRMR